MLPTVATAASHKPLDKSAIALRPADAALASNTPSPSEGRGLSRLSGGGEG